ITAALIQRYEKQHGDLKAGDVVVFRSGWSDRHVKPFPQGNACMADPLQGKSEGWPAPGPEAVLYLAERGVRCVATDGPARGGAEASPVDVLGAGWQGDGRRGVPHQRRQPV